ncbi:MAG: D-alanyl-D-alanine carboxypeptidase family protein [Actinomycetota bacterium]|nr:D-alanyl-D-alanine carboxypeptidase family protein [Actinomycetota bacterium]
MITEKIQRLRLARRLTRRDKKLKEARAARSKRIKWPCDLFVIILTLALLIPSLVFASPPPIITASSAILIDAKTGRTLWEKNSMVQRPVASTTKMMTAILAIENSNLEDIAITSPQAAAAGEAEIYLEPGEMITVRNLLLGTLLKSGNDSAVALAEHTSGSVKDFVAQMNEKAVEIGAKDTVFRNPTGLEEAGHKSTAYDLGLIARYALQNETFAQMVATKSCTIPWPSNTFPRSLTNHNKLLLKYEYVTGVKTGYTKEAGHCLVSSAVKGDKKLIAVVLNSIGSEECYLDSEVVLNYGFANFDPKTVLTVGEEFEAISIWGRPLSSLTMRPAKEVVMLMAEGERLTFKKSIVLSYPNRGIKRGEKVGELILGNEDDDLTSVDLVATSDVDKGFFWILWDAATALFAKTSSLLQQIIR